MKIKWIRHYSLKKRERRESYILFFYSAGISEIFLRCGYCRKSVKPRIKKVRSEKGYLHWAKICPKCKVSFPLTEKERKKLYLA